MDFERCQMVSSNQSAAINFIKIWLIVALFLLAVLQNNVQKTNVYFYQPKYFTAEKVLSKSEKYYLINTEGCRIEAMNPFDSTIQEFLVDKNKISDPDSGEHPIKCSPNGLPPLVSSNLTHIFIDKKSLILHHFNQLTCCYQPFWRDINQDKSSSGGHQIDRDFKELNKCIKFEMAAFMEEYEFVKVKCLENGTNIVYEDFHSFTPRKIKNKSKSNKQKQDKVSKVNVLMLGVDAVSRSNLIRQMPITVSYLKNDLEALELLGYNKVGDNTFPNLVPVLTGLSEGELVDNCWPTTDTYFDDCPFLWKNYSEAGYTTCFAEDASWMGIFNYVKSGFFEQPTDYYWGTFNRRVEDDIGSDKRLNAKLCCGYRITLTTLLDYAKKFVHTMASELFFGFFWGASISHDYLNLPMYSDDLHKDFLADLFDKGILNNTILIFMSDHGIRWGGIRSTHLGYLEERLPFLYFVFPKWFKKKYTTAIGNLRMNRYKLTTPFDLHETLSDILNLEKLQVANLKQRSTTKELSKRGISLFLPIPKNRTCQSAKIPENWCTCHQSVELSVEDESVVLAAKHLVLHINSLITNEKKCASLTLKRIVAARADQTLHSKNESFLAKEKTWVRDYVITIETYPGLGHFEATVRDNADGSLEAVGTVSRINTYGSQSKCLANYKLKLYCFCIDGNFL